MTSCLQFLCVVYMAAFTSDLDSHDYRELPVYPFDLVDDAESVRDIWYLYCWLPMHGGILIDVIIASFQFTYFNLVDVCTHRILSKLEKDFGVYTNSYQYT